MAVMEVHLPSGFTADIDALPSLLFSHAHSIKKVETKDGDTTIVVYFDSVGGPVTTLLAKIFKIWILEF